MVEKKTPAVLERIMVVVGFAMFLYHMVSTQYLFAGAYEHQDIHLGFLLTLVFLETMMKHQRRWIWICQAILIVLSLVAVVYVFVNIGHLEEVIGLPDPIDVVIGILLIILVIEGTRQAWGLVLPIVTCLSIVYFSFGHFIPGALHHKQFSFDYIISRLSIGLSGIYGTFLSLSANEVFLFVLFGSLHGSD